MSFQNELRERITNQIVNALENHELPPWRMPWTQNAGFPCNVVSRRNYSGLNPIVLQISAQRHGFKSRFWATFRQWESLGGTVNRRPENIPQGRWGTQIVYCQPVAKTKPEKGEEEAENKFLALRSYTVFNLDQISGPFDHLRLEQVPQKAQEIPQRYELADAVIKATGAKIRFGGDRAFYRIEEDYIQVPHREQFELPEFYETIFHELAHWSEHPKRLNWSRANPVNSYSMGELIAELSAVYMAGELNLPSCKNLSNHVAYLNNWLLGMKQDAKFIFRAAAQASCVVDYLMSFSRAQIVSETEIALV